MRALMTAATGMKSQELSLDVIAHNLANVNTAGFKKSEVSFEDLLYVNLRTAGVTDASGTQSAAGLQIGSGAAAVSTTAHHTQGTLEQTGRDLDLAIDGEGFFRVELASGETRYTRNGSFKLNSDGEIVTSEGYKLGISGITSATDRIQVGLDGTVSVRASGATAATSIGQIALYRFANPAGLENAGGNLFKENPAAGSPQTVSANVNGGGIKSGYLERSNVDVVGELIKMIMAQRAYEVNSRAIKAGDQMMSISSRLGS